MSKVSWTKRARERLLRMIEPTITRTSYTTRPLTQEEAGAFNAAFTKMGEAFDELDKVFGKSAAFPIDPSKNAGGR